MENISDIAKKYSTDKKTAAEPVPAEPVVRRSETDSQVAAVLLVRGMEYGFRLLDDRIELTERERNKAKPELGPVIEQHGAGRVIKKIPHHKAARGGLYFGRMFRKLLDQFNELKAGDLKSRGNQREHQAQKSAQPLPGAERPREKPSTTTSQWDSANG